MTRLFSYTNVKELDLSRINTTGVKDMSYMFYEARQLTSINFGNFDTSKVTSMNYMFLTVHL